MKQYNFICRYIFFLLLLYRWRPQMVTHTLVEKILIALFSSISYQSLRKRWQTFETSWAFIQKKLYHLQTVFVWKLRYSRDSFVIPHLHYAFLVWIFLLVQKSCCLFLVDSVTYVPISLLTCIHFNSFMLKTA